MDGPNDEALSETVRRLAAWIARDPTLRAGLQSLARLVLEATAAERDNAPLPERVDPAETHRDAAPAAVSPTPRPSIPLPPLTLGQPRPPRPAIIELPPSLAQKAAEPEPDELKTVAARARLKAAATRWAALREGEPSAFVRPDEIDTQRDWQTRARELPGCTLWMLPPHSPPLAGRPPAAEWLAQGFEALAEAAELLDHWQHGPDPRTHATEILRLVAETQSALRVAVEDLGGRKDADQFAVYSFLRETAREMNVFIDRYMRLDDAGDPASLPELRRRLAEQNSLLEEARADARQRRRRLRRIAYHANLIREGTGTLHDWRTLAETAAALVRDGLPPSSPALREPLLPIFDEMPELDDLPEAFDLVYREIDHFLALQQHADGKDASPNGEEVLPEVRRVADLLRGRVVVFIGGEARPHNVRRLEEAFDLDSLDWISTRDHQSIAPFEAHIARPEVALVIVAIRWSNHSFEGVKTFCHAHGKPLLRLKAGYSPNQVAVQVLQQCSQQLEVQGTPS